MEKASGVGMEYVRVPLLQLTLLFSTFTTGLVIELSFVEQSPNIKLG